MGRILSATLVGAFVVAAGGGAARAQWGPEVPLSATGADVWGSGLAATGTTVHVVYGTGEVRYVRSDDEGATWGTPRRLDGSTLHLTDPIVADGDDVWVIALANLQSRTDWCCAREVGDVYLLRSADRGQTWQPARRLTTSRNAFRVSLAYAAGRLHLVWMDFRRGAWDTYYLRSRDRGATWDPEVRIAVSAGTFGAERPQVAARGDSVHVTIWDDRGTNPPCMAGPTFRFDTCPDTFAMRSLDGGTTWGPELPVAYSGAAIAGRNDVAVAGPSSVVINFNRAAENTSDANPHMFVVRSRDDGATWDPPVQLNDTPGQADHGSIIGAGPAVHLAWHDSRGGPLAIYYRGSWNAGESWEPEERVSGTSTEASTPLVATTAGYLHVLWLDRRGGNFQIYYRRRAAAPPVMIDGPVDAATGLDATSGPDAPTGPGASGDEPGGCGCHGAGRAGGLLAPFGTLASLGVMARRRRRRG